MTVLSSISVQDRYCNDPMNPGWITPLYRIVVIIIKGLLNIFGCQNIRQYITYSIVVYLLHRNICAEMLLIDPISTYTETVYDLIINNNLLIVIQPRINNG